MEIVVRTPHGDADISIVSHAPTTTLGDVMAAVTGQAVPRLVLVDGRTVDATTVLDEAGLGIGSVVTPEPPVPGAASDTDVVLLQIAGHGAGRVARLGTGRYRIGPGRRSNAGELDLAPVEHPIFELVVEPGIEPLVEPVIEPVIEPAGTHGSSGATVVPESAPTSGLAIDGVRIGAVASWSGGTLTVGSRAFQIDRPTSSGATAHVRQRPEPDGTMAFSRPPRRRSAPDRRPVIDGLLDASSAAPTLWERRSGHADAFALPIGMRVDDGASIHADLGSDRAIAITGSERFRSALARTMVIEAVTLHGPADLDLVVLTDPARLAEWDWAKWLPHVRLGGPAAIWSSRHEIARWVEATTRREASTTPSRNPPHLTPGHLTPPHLTLVILDDPGLWNRRESPARWLVSTPPDDLRLIALCDDANRAPASCTTVISEADDDLARVHSFPPPGDEATMNHPVDALVRVALTEPDVAGRVARALAPLADVELPPALPATTDEDDLVDRVELVGLIGAAQSDDILTRWTAADPRPTVVIGRLGHDVVEVRVADEVTVVVGPSMGDAFDVAATWLLAQCVERSPDALWVVPLAIDRSARSELLWSLPHATERHDVDEVIEPGRLLARVRAVLEDGPARVVLVAETARDSATALDGAWLRSLADGVHATSGLSMIVVTDRNDVANSVGDTVIRVERNDPPRSGADRIATVTTRDGSTGERFAPLQPTPSDDVGLQLRPYVIGRSLTALERRIEQLRARSASVPDPALGGGLTMLRDAAARWRVADSPPAPAARTAVPPPFPTRVDLDAMFDHTPGDGVPLGLVDDPAAASVRSWWWEPGGGSLLAFGSRRSGIEQVTATIVLGVVDRFPEPDVRLVVIEPSTARRRALGGVDRSMRIVAPDQSDEVEAALEEIATELDRRANQGAAANTASTRSDRSGIVVVIGDLVQLRRRYAGRPLGDRIDEVLTRAAVAGSGVDVVAVATELDGAGPFAAVASSRLVGASSDHGELAALGVEEPGELDGVVGRCRAFPGGHLVQLATTDTAFDLLLARRSIGGFE